MLISIINNFIVNALADIKITYISLRNASKSFVMNAIFLSFQFLVSTTSLTIVLLIITVVFAFLIVGAILKMYKLKAENKRLTETDDHRLEVENSYKDFTEGHLYDNK